MKILYLDCSMGASGDMLAAALLELLPDRDAFVEVLNALSIPGVTFTAAPAVKCGIRGTHVSVRYHGQEEAEDAPHGAAHGHHHRGPEEIRQIINGLPVPPKVMADITAVYSLLAEAESRVHGVPVTEIHFHELGTADAIADVAAVCLLMDRLAPEKVFASPVHVGSGQVRCAHGLLPVPAPATAVLLKDVPIYGGEIRGELCTPTGAALLRHFVSSFGPMPVFRPSAVGYGMGTRDFPAANCLRAVLGESDDADDAVSELRCNLDDMTPEAVGFAQEQLLAAGALDVYTVPIQMKKSRPGTMLCVLCRPGDREEMARLLFAHTTTLGVRFAEYARYTLTRSAETLDTPWGEVRKKTASGHGVTREKYEYDDLARIARAEDVGLAEAERRVRAMEKQST